MFVVQPVAADAHHRGEGDFNSSSCRRDAGDPVNRKGKRLVKTERKARRKEKPRDARGKKRCAAYIQSICLS